MKSGQDLGSFEVGELPNNKKIQQQRILLPNTGIFMTHNLIWAKRS